MERTMLTNRRSPQRRADTIESHRRAVERAIATMRVRLGEPLSLRDLANSAFMSPYHFNRTFREMTGLPPRHFLSMLRLETAKRLLLTTQASVTDVCLDVGYTSLGTFVRRFHNMLGVSPRRLRRLRPRNAPRNDRARAVDGAIVSGEVVASGDFSGAVIIGLFETPAPQGPAVACAMLPRPGRFRMTGVPDGQFYLFAAGLIASDSADAALLHESAPRGGGLLIDVHGGRVHDDLHVELRSPVPLDLPILVPVAAIAEQHAMLRQRGAVA
jgi:AraC family transcriptional regulator